MAYKVIKLDTPTKYLHLLDNLVNELIGKHPLISYTTEEEDTKENLVIIGDVVTKENLEELTTIIGNPEGVKGILFIADQINQELLIRLAKDTGRRVLSKPNDSELAIDLQDEKIVCTIRASNSGDIAVSPPTFFLTMPGQKDIITTAKSSYDIDHDQDFGQFVDIGDYNPPHQHTPRVDPVFSSQMVTPSVHPQGSSGAAARGGESKYGDKNPVITSQKTHRW